MSKAINELIAAAVSMVRQANVALAVIQKAKADPSILDTLPPEMKQSVADASVGVLDKLIAIARNESIDPSVRQQAAQQAVAAGAGALGLNMEMNAVIRETMDVRAGYAQIRAAGYESAKAGVNWKDNPYDRSQFEYREWERGWCSAMNIDPISWRPMREIFAEDRQKAAS